MIGELAISSIAQIGGKLIDRLFPDKTEADKHKLQLFEMQQKGILAELAADTELAKAASEVIKAEANSNSWLARSWRPITMLTFVSLIVARMFGFTADNVGEVEYLKLWDLVTLGLGGYVIGRSVEKIAPAVITAVAGKKES
jgi:hypothetical protein